MNPMYLKKKDKGSEGSCCVDDLRVAGRQLTVTRVTLSSEPWMSQAWHLLGLKGKNGRGQGCLTIGHSPEQASLGPILAAGVVMDSCV